MYSISVVVSVECGAISSTSTGSTSQYNRDPVPLYTGFQCLRVESYVCSDDNELLNQSIARIMRDPLLEDGRDLRGLSVMTGSRKAVV